MKVNRRQRRVSALGLIVGGMVAGPLCAAVLAPARIASADTSSTSSPKPAAQWWTDGTAPRCSANDPVVEVTVQPVVAGGTEVAFNCTRTASASRPYASNEKYACWSTAKSNRCPPPGPQFASVPANYLVMSVLYSPPGSAASGGQKSTADYATGSSTGCSVSSSSSFKSDYSVTASVSAGDPKMGPNASASASFEWSNQSSSSSEEDFTKSSNQDLKVPGSGTDGIDHDLDLIELWLNPQINFSVPFPYDGHSVSWGATPRGSTMVTQHVYVGWLKHPSPCSSGDPTSKNMPCNVQQALASAHITSADYATILARDPFAGGGTYIDPSRFWPLNQTFDYEPPYPGDSSPSDSYSLKNDTTSKSSSSSTDSYQVGMNETLGYNWGLVSASVKTSNTWTWTNTSTLGHTQESSQTASLTITGPSGSYTGPTIVDVYYDTLYSTFLFAFHPESQASARVRRSSAHGTVTGSNGRPAAHEEVVLTVGGTSYRTVTNHRGQYYFFDTPGGGGTLRIRGVAHPVSVRPGVEVPGIRL